MGGRGTYASGNNVSPVYKTVLKIQDVKVLEPIRDEKGKPVSNQHGLPEESHSSWAYIKLKKDGTFHEMRIYDKEHFLIKEIGYHPEHNINNGNYTEPVLHIHEYDREFKRRTIRRITELEYQLYKKYFLGLPDNVKR